MENAGIHASGTPLLPVGCVIMASGQGKRFGGNKLLADFGGRPLIEWILDITDEVYVPDVPAAAVRPDAPSGRSDARPIPLFAARVVVTRHEAVARICDQRGIKVVLHDLPERSDTIRLGLASLTAPQSPTAPQSLAVPQLPTAPQSPQLSGCLFCPGDQPLLSRATLEALVITFSRDPNRIVRPCHKDTPGSPVLFGKHLFPELLSLPTGKGGSYLIKKYPGQVQYIPVRDPWELQDADTPEELHALSQHIAPRSRQSFSGNPIHV